MKNIFILCTLALALMLGSCSDFLDQDNRSSVPANSFYKTKEGFASLSNTPYSMLRSFYTNSSLLFIAGTDIYADGKTQGVIMSQYTFTSAQWEIQEFYKNCYKGIQLANAVLAYGAVTEDSNVRLQYMDEARFLRAWYFFTLAQHFGGVALTTEMYDYPAMSHERASLGDTYKFIIDELTYLASSESKLLDYSASSVGRPSKRAASFCLAKAYLTRGWLDGTSYAAQEENIAQSSDFENASKYAMQSIANEIPSLSIETAFDIKNENNSEIFWSVQYDKVSVVNLANDGSRQQALFGTYLGGPENFRNKSTDGTICPALRLHQMYEKGDGRWEQTFMSEFHQFYFDYYSARNTSPIKYYYAPSWATDEDIAAWKADDPNGLKKNTIISKTVANGGISPSTNVVATYKDRRSHDFGAPCIKKFDDYSESSIANRSINCSMHDVVVARLGEAYLIAAEAYMKQNKNDQAAKMINDLRKRPGTIKKGFEAAMTVKASDIDVDFILAERAREMAGEYVRWTDLKRTLKLVEYATKYNEDGISDSNMKGDDGKYKTLRPIPQAAIDLNQTKVKQNPGY